MHFRLAFCCCLTFSRFLSVCLWICLVGVFVSFFPKTTSTSSASPPPQELMEPTLAYNQAFCFKTRAFPLPLPWLFFSMPWPMSIQSLWYILGKVLSSAAAVPVCVASPASWANTLYPTPFWFCQSQKQERTGSKWEQWKVICQE